jgi:LmbE family N-acetylglucosaminyl deacetylase
LNIADGCCGSAQYSREEIARMRRLEAIDAAASIGAVFHESLAADAEIFYEKPLLARVASIVRAVAPQIVLTHAPSDYMEDHMNACRLAVTAAFCRGMPNFPVEPPRKAISGKVTVYHAQPYGNRDPLGQVITPGLFVDVSGKILERKIDMLARHKSQRDWLDESQGLDSYIEKMKQLCEEVAGMASGAFEHAEGWRKHLHLGFCDAEDDPLFDALGEFVMRASEVEPYRD